MHFVSISSVLPAPRSSEKSRRKVFYTKQITGQCVFPFAQSVSVCGLPIILRGSPSNQDNLPLRLFKFCLYSNSARLSKKALAGLSVRSHLHPSGPLGLLLNGLKPASGWPGTLRAVDSHGDCPHESPRDRMSCHAEVKR
jgi:hypothetical protein